MPGLFSPITIRGVRFANRIVMPPMVRSAAQMPAEVVQTGGRVTDAVVEHYARRARAGVGLIIVEATAVDEAGRVWRDGLNLFADEHMPDLARLASAICSVGARCAIQLVHGGPQASPLVSRRPIVGPSAVRDSEGVPLPRELSADEIAAVQQRFADAAGRAVQAGFEMIEIHGAHGYLLDSFLMRGRNQRSDEYGGAVANRMRMMVETCRAVRQRIGDSTLLCCRISIFNKPAAEQSPTELHELVRALDQAGIDLLHVSTDGAFKGCFGTDRPIGRWVRDVSRLPVIISGGLGDPADANRLIAEGDADFAAVGIGMLRDPDWAATARRQLATS